MWSEARSDLDPVSSLAHVPMIPLMTHGLSNTGLYQTFAWSIRK